MKGFFDRFREGFKPMEARPESLMEVVLNCFNNNGWKFRRSEPANLVQFGFNGRNANYEGGIFVEEEAEEVLVMFRAPNRVPQCRRLAAAELLARANWGMKFGALEMEYDDGEVRFKVSAILRQGQLSPQMIHAMVGIAFTTLDHHYPALMAVCFGNVLPSDALQAVRGRQGGMMKDEG